MSHAVDLSIGEARKLALVSQQLPTSAFRSGRAGICDALAHLGYVQIDTLSVVERSHHMTLWNRVDRYRRSDLDRLVQDRSILEYWAHAAAYLPMTDYRFALPRMRAVRQGQRHWYDRNPRLMREILARVRADGPVRARDIDGHGGRGDGMWEWGPVKQAVEMLFMEGSLLVTRREGFQKVFDLAERVVPPGTDTSPPSTGEYAHWLIARHLKAHGIGRPAEFRYLRKGLGPAVKTALEEKLESGEVVPVRVGRSRAAYYAGSDFAALLSKRLSRNRVKFLSPFDNLVIQRKRLAQLFDFDYQLECYVSPNKRRYGYFCLPVLWRGRLVARMDAKANRGAGIFQVRSLVVEPTVTDVPEFARQAAVELERLAAFLGCEAIEAAASPRPLAALIREAAGEVRREAR